MNTIKDKIRTVGEVFADNRTVYNSIVGQIQQLSGEVFKPNANDPWYTVKDKLNGLHELKHNKEKEDNELTTYVANQFKEGIVDVEPKEPLNNGNELVIPTSISDAKQNEALMHHTSRINEISKQIDERIATLDDHIKICNMRLAELKKLKVGYAAFKSSTTPRKRLAKKPAKKTTVKSKKLAASTKALNEAFGKTS